MDRPLRLQGTDGIRAAVGPDNEASRRDPLGTYLRTGRLTPAFATLYARAFAEEETSPGEEVIVGWDPRDRGGDFTKAVVGGVLQAGRRPVVLGTVPTPAVPLLMIRRKSNAGIMVTASHNPESQNGLKLFLGPLATKLYPADEERLTRKVYDLGGSPARSSSEGEPLLREAEARRAFIDDSCDPFNSWLPEPVPGGSGAAEGPLADLLLVVDAAGGSMAGLAADVLRRLGAGEVVEVNGTGAPINEDGGVVDLEQVHWVDADCRSDAGKDLSRHAGVAALIEAAGGCRPELLSGKRWAAGAVFDGDGDRAVLLFYDPFSEGAAVLDGDRAALHMARFLSDADPNGWKGTSYVNTVDSDLGAAAAASELGFAPALSAVGDKWLLWRAGLACARAGADEAGGPSGSLGALEAGEGDARALAAYLRDLSREPADALLTPGRIPFALGSEASGHHVTLGRTQVDGNFSPVFAGNGLKAATNTLAAIRALSMGRSVGEWVEAVCRPYPTGYRKTYYAFYTDREKFAPGTDAWRKMEELLPRTCESKLGKRCRSRRLRISEDPGMLYLALEDAEGVQRAAVFVRNSGTEERTGVTVQGVPGEAAALNEIGETGLRSLLADLKRGGHPYAEAEREILGRLTGGTLSVEEAGKEVGKHVEVRRLFKEMERQGLILVEGGTVAATDIGRWYAENAAAPSG